MEKTPTSRERAIIDPDLETLIGVIGDLMKQNTFPVIVITGKERMSGKSTLAYWIGALLSERMNNSFGVDNFIWNSDQIIDQIHRLPRYSTLIFDEAGLDFYSREAMSKTNRTLNKAIMVCGYRNQCLILCIPSLWDLDRMVRDRRCDYWFHCKFELSQMDWGTYLDRGYSMVRTNLKQNAFDKRVWWESYGHIVFDDMLMAFKGEYVARKESQSLQRFTKDEKKGSERKRDILMNYFENRDGFFDKYGIDGDAVTDTSIMELLGVSRPLFYDVKKEFKTK